MNDVKRAGPVARARGLAGVIAAAADTTERDRRIPKELLDQLHEARLFRMLYPRSVGGDEIEPGEYVLAVGELAQADGSVGWCASIANSIGLFAPYLGLDAARKVFGDPRATCAWGHPTNRRRSRCRAATASPAVGISPAAAAMQAGWARTAP